MASMWSHCCWLRSGTGAESCQLVLRWEMPIGPGKVTEIGKMPSKYHKALPLCRDKVGFFYCWEFQTISDQLENKSKLIYAQSLGQACLAKGMGFSSRRIFHDAFEALEMQGMSLQWSSWQWVMISCASHPCWFTLIPCWNPRKDFSIVWMDAMKCWPNNWKKPVRRNSMNWLPLWKRTSPICIEGQITSGFWQILIAHGRTAAGWIS